jgi:AcrR family transcriptional regulator
MKQENQQTAERLYFQTDLSNTEIAEAAGISRRTLYYYIKDNEWDRLKKSAQHMPSLLAENMYLIMAKMQADLMSESHAYTPVTPQEMKMVDMASRTIHRLRNRHTVNETLELQAHLMDYVQQHHPEAVATLQPIIKGFLKSRAKVQPHQFMAGKLTNTGAVHQSERDIQESQLDLENMMYWADNPTLTPQDIEGPNDIAPNHAEATLQPEATEPYDRAKFHENCANIKTFLKKKIDIMDAETAEYEANKLAKKTLSEAEQLQNPSVAQNEQSIIHEKAVQVLKGKTFNRAQRREQARSATTKNQNNKAA